MNPTFHSPAKRAANPNVRRGPLPPIKSGGAPGAAWPGQPLTRAQPIEPALEVYRLGTLQQPGDHLHGLLEAVEPGLPVQQIQTQHLVLPPPPPGPPPPD